MRLAAMQPYFFPYIGYFQAMAAVDRYVLYDRLTYIPKGFVHRNRFLMAGQGAHWFGAALRAKSSNILISDICVADDMQWRRRVRRMLGESYRRSPQFETVFPLVEAVLDLPDDRLARINAASIAAVRDYLGIGCELVPDASGYAGVEAELAALYADGAPQPGIGRKVMRALKLCARDGADIFVNAIGGRDLYDPALFARHGIDLWFVQSDLPEYPQFNSRSFVPGLSILDMLFNCSRDHARDLLARYRLVR